ncbi:hypothetical protein [Tuwongella immobilis]|uniref:hypothetical protein n=1 Tax=Tuwongella immobilis TaxID=692036 RepID=UPI0013A6EB98|nr:hypothetical protein [Tuwongella immobilis]
MPIWNRPARYRRLGAADWVPPQQPTSNAGQENITIRQLIWHRVLILVVERRRKNDRHETADGFSIDSPA